MNISIIIEMAATAFPDHTAVIADDGVLTYAALQDSTQGLGSRVGELAGNGALAYVGTAHADFPRLLFAAGYARVPFIPLNYRLKQSEYERLLQIAEPGLVIVDERYYEMVSAAAAAVSPRPRVARFGDLAAGPAGGTAEVSAPMDPQVPAVRLFTSGTASAPKLVNLTHSNLVSYVLEAIPAASAGASEVALLAAPPYHIAAVANLLTSVFRCRTVRLMEQFDPQRWLEIVQEDKVTHAMVVPTMMSRILDVLEDQPELRPATLMNLAYGGSRAPLGLVERALRNLPDSVGLVNAFGLTETSSTVAMLSPEDHRAAWQSPDERVRRRLGSVGRTVPGIEALIVDEDGAPVTAGEQGEVLLRGNQITTGYVSGGRAVDGDGWLHTGDLGYLDEDGFLFIAGRRDDLIIRGAENINPTEIEDVLRSHPDVADALVFGIPDEEWGEVVVALVAGAAATTSEELQAFVRGRLAGYKVPTRLQWVADLPRNDLGKPVRAQAKVMFAP